MEKNTTKKNKAETIEQLSRLSMLSLPEAQHDSLMEDLASILKYIARLSTIAVDGTMPTYHGTREEMVIRPDMVFPSAFADALVARAPAQQERQIQVKGVFGNGT